MNREAVTFEDDFTRIATVGDKVAYRYATRYGGHGTGTVLGFRRDCGSTNVLIEPDPDAVYGWLDRWPLRTGGEFNGPRRQRWVHRPTRREQVAAETRPPMAHGTTASPISPKLHPTGHR